MGVEEVEGAVNCGLAILGGALLLIGFWRLGRAVRVWMGRE